MPRKKTRLPHAPTAADPDPALAHTVAAIMAFQRKQRRLHGPFAGLIQLAAEHAATASHTPDGREAQ
jgi:hypothetical protein